MPHTKEMRTLPIPTGRLLIVPGETMPEDAKNFTVIESHGYFPSPRIEHSIGGVDLPPGSWSLLGKASELTEEQMKRICGKIHVEEAPSPYNDMSGGWHLAYIDYLNQGEYTTWAGWGGDAGCYKKVSDSYASFLTFHGIKENDILLIEKKMDEKLHSR